MALIPEGVLPPLADALEEADLSCRDERLLLMVSTVTQALLPQYHGEPLPFIMAGPENYPELINQLPTQFFSLLQAQADLPISYSASRIVSTGRTGMLEAIRLAQFYLASGHYEQVLVAGADSCEHTAWLHMLDRNGRLKSESPSGRGDTFVPGEGVAMLLLTNNPDLSMHHNGHRITLGAPGFGDEPGHL